MMLVYVNHSRGNYSLSDSIGLIDIIAGISMLGLKVLDNYCCEQMLGNVRNCDYCEGG